MSTLCVPAASTRLTGGVDHLSGTARTVALPHPNTPPRRPAATTAHVPHASARSPAAERAQTKMVHCPRALDGALPRCGGGGRPRPRRRRRAVRLRPSRRTTRSRSLLRQGHHQRGDRPPQEAHPVEGGVRDGVMTNQVDFFIMQAHHDYCDHDTLRTGDEKIFHDWESFCLNCVIKREHDDKLKDCPAVACSDHSILDAAHFGARQQLRGRGGRRRPRRSPSVGAGAPRAPPRRHEDGHDTVPARQLDRSGRASSPRRARTR